MSLLLVSTSKYTENQFVGMKPRNIIIVKSENILGGG